MHDDRLQRLLGGLEHAQLRSKLRARFERGSLADEFALTGLTSVERRALEGLLGDLGPTSTKGAFKKSYAQAVPKMTVPDHAAAQAQLKKKIEQKQNDALDEDWGDFDDSEDTDE